MKLTDEIGALLQELRPLRKKLRDKELQYLDKNDIDRIYLQHFGDSQTDQVIEQRERSTQIVRLQRQCDNIIDEYEDLRSLCSKTSLHQLALEVYQARKELFQMKEEYLAGARKLDRVVRKIEILKMSDCYDGVQEQRERISDLKGALKTHVVRYEKLREKNKRYVIEIQRLRQDNAHRPDVVRKREDAGKIKQLEEVLSEKREILAATQARYRRILEMNANEVQSPPQRFGVARKVSPPPPVRQSPKVAKPRAVAYDPDDESFSEPVVEELVVAVGLFRRNVTENEVRALFSKFGAINGLRVYPKHGTSPQAYFAKIAFYDHCVAEKAIEKMNGRFFEDHALNVKWARDQAFCASLSRGSPRKGMFSDVSSEQQRRTRKRWNEPERAQTKERKEQKRPEPVLLSESSSDAGYNDSPAMIEPLKVGASDSSSSSLDLDPTSGEVKVIQKPKSESSASKKEAPKPVVPKKIDVVSVAEKDRTASRSGTDHAKTSHANDSSSSSRSKHSGDLKTSSNRPQKTTGSEKHKSSSAFDKFESPSEKKMLSASSRRASDHESKLSSTSASGFDKLESQSESKKSISSASRRSSTRESKRSSARASGLSESQSESKKSVSSASRKKSDAGSKHSSVAMPNTLDSQSEKTRERQMSSSATGGTQRSKHSTVETSSSVKQASQGVSEQEKMMSSTSAKSTSSHKRASQRVSEQERMMSSASAKSTSSHKQASQRVSEQDRMMSSASAKSTSSHKQRRSSVAALSTASEDGRKSVSSASARTASEKARNAVQGTSQADKSREESLAKKSSSSSSPEVLDIGDEQQEPVKDEEKKSSSSFVEVIADESEKQKPSEGESNNTANTPAADQADTSSSSSSAFGEIAGDELKPELPKPVLGRLLTGFTSKLTDNTEQNEQREVQPPTLEPLSSFLSRNMPENKSENGSSKPVIEENEKPPEVDKASESSSSFVEVVDVASSSSSSKSGHANPSPPPLEPPADEKPQDGSASQGVLDVASSSDKNVDPDNKSDASGAHSEAHEHSRRSSGDVVEIHSSSSSSSKDDAKDVDIPKPDVNSADHPEGPGESRPQTTDDKLVSDGVVPVQSSSSTASDVPGQERTALNLHGVAANDMSSNREQQDQSATGVGKQAASSHSSDNDVNVSRTETHEQQDTTHTVSETGTKPEEHKSSSESVEVRSSSSSESVKQTPALDAQQPNASAVDKASDSSSSSFVDVVEGSSSDAKAGPEHSEKVGDSADQGAPETITGTQATDARSGPDVLPEPTNEAPEPGKVSNSPSDHESNDAQKQDALEAPLPVSRAKESSGEDVSVHASASSSSSPVRLESSKKNVPAKETQSDLFGSMSSDHKNSPRSVTQQADVPAADEQKEEPLNELQPLAPVPRKPLFGRLLQGIGEKPLASIGNNPEPVPPSGETEAPVDAKSGEPQSAAPAIPSEQPQNPVNGSSSSDGVVEINVSDDQPAQQDDSVDVEILDPSSSAGPGNNDSSDSNDF